MTNRNIGYTLSNKGQEIPHFSKVLEAQKPDEYSIPTVFTIHQLE
jgi:hypothetical protein